MGERLADGNGGATVRVIAGGASPAMVWRKEALGRLNVAVRCLCAQSKGGKRSRKGESTGAELTSKLSRAPASNYQGRDAYHGEVARARGARGDGGVAGETERSPASCGGRASELRRGAACGGDGGRALLLLTERETKGGARNAMPGELYGSLSSGQHCQSYRGAWTRCQAAVDGWRHAAGKP